MQKAKQGEGPQNPYLGNERYFLNKNTARYFTNGAELVLVECRLVRPSRTARKNAKGGKGG